MSEPAILPVCPQSLSDRDRAALRRAGVVVIEHENPDELRLLRPSADVDASDMLRCALTALAHGPTHRNVGDAREQFVRLLAAVVAGNAGGSDE
jgi:nucleoside-diphosphate-sugar epimerase